MKKDHQILFTPYKIAGCELKNRYAMAAMGTGGMVTKENTFNERGVEYYVARAKGGVGLIITGTLYVENEIERVVPGVMPCPTDNPGAFTMTSAEMCERVHAYGSKIFAQLTAGFGRVLKPHLYAGEAISASPIENYWDPAIKCRALTREEIQTIVEKAGDSALICRNAGFDGVEIHAVHEGYLLDQFAMSLFNNRTDEYGGNLRGRLKFACDIVKNIKAKCGQDFPVIMRYCLKSYIKELHQGALPGESFAEMGRDIGEGVEGARILVEAGYDALDVDAGTYDSWYWSHPPMYFEKGMNLPFGQIVKESIDIPVIIAGRMEDPDLAANALREGKTDLISLGRSLLADPDIVNKIRGGQFELARPCLGCHEGCMNRLISARPVSCAVNPQTGREKLYGLQPTLQKRRVVIVGAGVSGMEAARVLKMRGHEVAVIERSGYAGGVLHIAGAPSFKQDDIRLVNWYIRTLEGLGVEICYNTEVTPEKLRSIPHDVLILATGSSPRELHLSGEHMLYKAEDILSGRQQAGKRVAIIGGGLVGCELALDLAEKGHDVTIIEALPEILSAGTPIPPMNRMMLLDLLRVNRVKILEGVKVEYVEGNAICCARGTEKEMLDVDTVVYAIGYHSNRELFDAVRTDELEIYLVGDARHPKNIMYAIWDAYELANNI